MRLWNQSSIIDWTVLGMVSIAFGTCRVDLKYTCRSPSKIQRTWISTLVWISNTVENDYFMLAQKIRENPEDSKNFWKVQIWSIKYFPGQITKNRKLLERNHMIPTNRKRYNNRYRPKHLKSFLHPVHPWNLYEDDTWANFGGHQGHPMNPSGIHQNHKHLEPVVTNRNNHTVPEYLPGHPNQLTDHPKNRNHHW